MNNVVARWACILEGTRATSGPPANILVVARGSPLRKSICRLANELPPSCHRSLIDLLIVRRPRQAGKIVTTVAGILFSMDCDTQPLEIKHIRERNAAGDWGGVHFNAGAGEIYVRGRTNFWGAEKQQSLSPSFALMADTDDVVMEVLHFLRRSPDWFDLYAAFERMRHDINTGLNKQKATAEIGWPSDREQDYFTESSNVYRHSKAKWGRYSPANAMPLREARQFVSDCLSKWLSWRARRFAHKGCS